MGAKKGKKGKKGKKKGGADTEPSPEEKNFIYQAEIESLQQKLMMESQRADVSKASENEKRHRELQLDKQLKDEEKRTRDIIADMTRQYKSMFEELTEKINKLEREVVDNDETISDLKEQYEKLNNEKLEIEKAKNEEIKELKKRIDDMSSDFAEMLRDTLHKMQERIEIANKQWEEENDANMLKRFEDMALGNKPN
ncbi:UNKNOWN [Stylonychia lemnae]|uniref:Dynein regulatory complex protein 12 n=1 Tax=Stylonychia lemnae TaxID=5949 RepID=A0A077ZVW3_STYLE|nr:UNKNOWN [Stylonychia lemnae]|eukprot:CDW73736.1 UNKNOWN [Stylonychia lemnae]